jgi:hypothetical protein
MAPEQESFIEEGLFGQIAIRNNYLTDVQVEAAKMKQKLLLANGVSKKLGAILVEDSILTHDQVREILALQKKAVLSCPGCSGMFNVEGFEPGMRFVCKNCGTVLQVPGPKTNVDLAEVIRSDEDTSMGFEPPPEFGGKEIGGCRIERVLGKGAMGSVYLARQISLDRPVALKVLSPGAGDNEQYIARFEREARTVARLTHPNIVQVFNMGRDEDGRYYIIMELVEGEALGTRVKDGGRLDEHEALGLILGAAAGLAEAHKAGVIHRDIKPDNIMVDIRGRVKVADFGLVREEKGSVNLTRSGATLGTPSYMAPEQGMGSDVSPRADLYSLGATLFRLLAGVSPYQADSAVAMMMKHVQEPVPHIRDFAPDVSKATDKLLYKALAKKPEDRFQTAGEFSGAVREILAGLGKKSGKLVAKGVPVSRTPARPAKVESRKARPDARRRKASGRRGGGRGPNLLLLGGAVAAVLVLVAVFAVVIATRDRGTGKAPEDGESAEEDPGPETPDEGDSTEPTPEPQPPPREDPKKVEAGKLLEETEKKCTGLLKSERFPEAMAAWNELGEELQKRRLPCDEEAITGKIQEIRTAWQKTATKRIGEVIDRAQKCIDGKDYAGALEALDGFPDNWRVLPGVEGKMGELAYLKSRAEYLKSRSGGSRTPRNTTRQYRRSLKVGETYEILAEKEKVQREWSQSGNVVFDEKEKILTLTVDDKAFRSSAFSNLKEQDRWLDYEVELEYQADEPLRFWFRINRSVGRHHEWELAARTSWTKIRIEVKGVVSRLHLPGKDPREMMLDMHPGYIGFVLDSDGAAHVRNLKFKVLGTE